MTTESRQIKIIIPNLPHINRLRLQHFLGQNARVSRNGIWVGRDAGTREWQIQLVQMLEKLASYRQKNRPQPNQAN